MMSIKADKWFLVDLPCKGAASNFFYNDQKALEVCAPIWNPRIGIQFVR